MSLDVTWKAPIVEMDEPTFQNYVKTSKTQKQNLSSQTQNQKLPDWRGLSKAEVHQQLRLYGVNPKDPSWYLDEKTPTTSNHNTQPVSNIEGGIRNGQTRVGRTIRLFCGRFTLLSFGQIPKYFPSTCLVKHATKATCPSNDCVKKSRSGVEMLVVVCHSDARDG